MAIQVSYPGVYIEEFAPGAPIEGVGTNVAAFIGTAMKGPISKPTLIQSWDAFKATFGGFIDAPPYGGYLAPAVYGFFLNGGTSCYLVRVGTGEMASVQLVATSDAVVDVLVVRAREEGPAGNALSVTVAHSSRLANLLTAAGSTDSTLSPVYAQTTVSAISSDRRALTVPADSNAGFSTGDRVLLTASDGTTTTGAVVDATPGNDTLMLVASVAETFDLSRGGSIRMRGKGPGSINLQR